MPREGAAIVPAAEFAYRHVVRALEARRRYRYVRPQVRRQDDGFLVVSPCCSRNVDPSGGEIAIAWIQRVDERWRLNRRDHASGDWIASAEGPLARVLELLQADPDRVFWP